MDEDKIASAMRRVEAVLRRRPDIGLHDDDRATVRWQGGTRVVAQHESGVEVATDMPTEFGGSGDRFSPGWLTRAALGACTATLTAMYAAAEGIELSEIEVVASSQSDTRALFDMIDAAGKPVYGGPSAVQLHVRIGAPGVSAERLRALVETAFRRSPVRATFEPRHPVTLHVDVVG